jgi:hypothetical protein
MSEIRANSITDAAGTGAPNFPNGLESNGVSVATTADIPSVNPFTLGTAVSSTSGTAIDFTGIPSWAKRVTVMMSGVSTNGTSQRAILIGDSGGIESTGYQSSAWTSSGAGTYSNSTSGFILTFAGGTSAAAGSLHGMFTLANLNGGSWVGSGSFYDPNYTAGVASAGSKTLSGTLDRVRITTLNGTDTFDAGTINISYEG